MDLEAHSSEVIVPDSESPPVTTTLDDGAGALPTPATTGHPSLATRHKPSTKTYSRVREPQPQQLAPPHSDDAFPVTVARSSSTPIIPETDPDIDMNLENGDFESGPEMDDHESAGLDTDEELDDASSRRARRHSSASAHCVLSTDPTSNEEGNMTAKRPSPARAASPDGDLSDDEEPALQEAMDVDARDGDEPEIFRRKTVAELMADIDAQPDEEDQLDPRSAPNPTGLAPPVPAAAAISSPLTSLIDSSVKLASSQPHLAPSSSPSHAATATAAPTTLFNPESDNSDDEPVTSKVPRPRQRRVVASDSEDSDAQGAQRPETSRRAVVAQRASHSDNSGDDAPVKELSAKERVKALAAKKRAPTLAEPTSSAKERDTSCVSGVESDEEAPKVAKAKKARASKKGLTKKGEDALHRETAALQRGQDVRLQARVKKDISVASVIANKNTFARNHTIRHHPPKSSFHPLTKVTTFPKMEMLPPTPDATAFAEISVHSSSSAIEDDYSTPRPLSEKALGKQRASSPIAASSTRRVVVLDRKVKKDVLPVAPGPVGPTDDDDDDDDEEEFLSIDKLMANAEKKKKDAAQKEDDDRERAFQDAKRRAAALAKASASFEDDDELEIEGDPRAVARQPFLTPRATFAGSTARRYNNLTDNHAYVEEDLTDSQLVVAGKTFGKDLSVSHAQDAELSRAARRKEADDAARTKKTKTKEIRVDQDQLNMSLANRIRAQNIASKMNKHTKHIAQRAQMEKEARLATVAAKVDVAGILTRKAERVQEEDEDEDADPDFMAGEDVGESEDEALRSGSEDEAAGSGSEDEAAGSGSEVGDLSSGEEEEGGEEQIDAVAVDGGAEEPTTPGAVASVVEEKRASVQVAYLELNSDVGFSQDFGFDNDLHDMGGDADGFGWQPKTQAFDEPGKGFVPDVIADQDRLKDLDNMQGGAAALPNTPVADPVRWHQYINKNGLYTQTMPDRATLFEDSPSDSPHESTLGRSLSLAGFESQSQTQLDANTPTQPPRFGKTLHRAEALVPYSTYGLPAIEVEEPSATSPVQARTSPEEEDSQMDEMPSAAQPPVRNAFDVLAKGAREALVAGPPPAAHGKRKEKNAFVVDEADMDDEEDMGMAGAGSGDEDETHLDDELESLVDNEEKDRDVVDEEDERVEELRAEHEAKAEEAREAKAKAIIEGKERLKRKNGGLDLDDDDYDDDGYGMARSNNKRARVENKTIVDLEANEETQSFVKPLKDGLVVAFKDGEIDFLIQSQVEESGSENEDGGEGEDEPVQNRYGAYTDDENNEEDEDEDEDDEAAPKRPLTNKERREKERKTIDDAKLRNGERNLSPSPRLYNGQSSSPGPKLKIKQKTAKVRLEVDEFTQHSLITRYARADVWKADSKEDSQGNSANGTTAGKHSAVTSFKRENHLAKATYGGTLSGGLHGKTDVAPRESRLGNFKKNGFAK